MAYDSKHLYNKKMAITSVLKCIFDIYRNGGIYRTVTAHTHTIAWGNTLFSSIKRTEWYETQPFSMLDL